MPLYLKEADLLSRVDGLASVLIVPCRFCPAASLAIRKKAPYIELFKRFLKTEAYESFIEDLRCRLDQKGIKNDVFKSNKLHEFVACMWTPARRRALAKRANEFEGVLVLGCDATTELVRDAVGTTSCKVIEGMEMEGVMNILPTMSFPFNITLELKGVTPLVKKEPNGLREKTMPKRREHQTS